MHPLLLLILLAVSPAGGERPSVVLVTLDTVRADRMGFLGAKGGTTPALDALAAQSIVFERAYAQAPITTASHASILSGTYPQLHRVNDFGVPLPESVPWLPALLAASGYRTAAFVGSLILDPRNGTAPGFDRGFETYDAGYRIRRGKEDRYQTMERRGEEVMSRALAWIEKKPPGPFLLWVHLFDAHDPYDPPLAFARKHAGRPYDGEIAYADAQVGRLQAALAARGLIENALVAVVADHGESLGEHGESKHGVFLYDATIRVPIILKLPKGRAAGTRVFTRARLVDLVPTVLETAGLAVPAAVQGESLLPLVEAGGNPERDAYAETDYPRRAFGWSALQAWRVERFLFVKAPRPELYDLPADPDEKRNIAEERASVAERIAARMEEFRRKTGGDEDGGAKPASLDPSLAERLAALGYASGALASTGSGAGIDPKDKVQVANTLHDAIVAVEDGDAAAAESLLEKVISTDPQVYMAQFQLGRTRGRQRQWARAIPPLRKAIELQPDSAMAHYEMALALYETGDLKTAAAHFEIVVRRLPKFADARYSLGSVYARIDRVPEALTELRAALELEPRHYRGNLLTGRILDLQGQPGEALAYLERAVEVNAASGEAHAFLADAYERLGRFAEARRERERAQALRPQP